ncbi:MAG: hypothetical protein IIC73_06600, partial [Armatimonadetes bacterium]|nr:hypothetical protein [Armatimonadota bacterium]
LLSHSAAVVVAMSFWYFHQMHQFLLGAVPLVILVAYRPRMALRKEDHRRPPEAEERSLPLNDVTQRELISVGSGDSLYR